MRAVQYLHQNNVVHRDIKPANILVDDQNNPKLIDFGISTKDKLICKDKKGTDFYLSPQATRDKEYNGEKADIWACGITLY